MRKWLPLAALVGVICLTLSSVGITQTGIQPTRVSLVASSVTQVVSATDLDVQSGGADILSTTSFNAAFGTAGTADSQVMSVQGIASMTALTVSATNLDVQIGGSDTVTVSASNLDVQIGGSDSLDNAELPAASAITDNFANPTTTSVMAMNMCWDGSAWDRCSAAGADTELPAAAALADDTSNPTVPGVAAFNMCWDGATWDRCQADPASAAADDMSNPTATWVLAANMCWDGSTWDRCASAGADTEMPNAATLADNTTNPSAPAVGSFVHVYDGATWDRWTGAVTATNLDVQIGGSDSLTIGTFPDNEPFNLAQMNGATTPMTTTQADDLALTLDGLNVSAFMYMYDGTNLDLVRGNTTDGLLVNLGANNDVTITSGTVTTVSTVTTLSQFGGNAINLGSGTIDTGTLRINIATDDPVNDSLVNLDIALNADEGAFTYATTQVLAIGAVAESTTDTLADGTVGAPVMTLSRFLRTTPTGYGTGGATPVVMLSDNTDNDDETAICTADCTVYSISAFNHTAASVFLRCEADTAGNTTPGSETASAGEFDLEIPAIATAPGGFHLNFPTGISYATALTCWLATGEASSDATDPGQNDVRVLFSRVQ